jgi:WD40 repeat protein
MRIVSGSDDNTVRVWGASTGAELKVLEGPTCALLNLLKGHTGIVHSVAFSAECMWVVSGSYDESVRMGAELKGQTSVDSDRNLSIFSRCHTIFS